MYRNALDNMTKWLTDPQRKPMVLRGARQVGKTWIVEHLAQRQQKQLININFEKFPQHRSLFNTNDPKQIIKNIQSELNVIVKPEMSLLFLDEIQAYPELLSQLRWFAEDMPELPVIAAGSLLEFVLADHSFSMPVGRIHYFYLEPLSFEEFLHAKGQLPLLEFIHTFEINTTDHYKSTIEIPIAIHERLIAFFKEYMLVGGMPAAVAQWVKTEEQASVHQIHHDLLSTYRDDFAKYAGRIPVARLQDIIHAIPKMLGEKFKFSTANPDESSLSLKKALELLSQARICHKIQAVSANGLPLAAEINEKFMKVILIDVGLVNSLLGMNLHEYKKVFDINLINQGGISEQVVGQLLRINFPFYVNPALFYWINPKANAAAEIDYVIQHHTQIIPIEVKSGSTGSLKSLHLYMAMKHKDFAIRINSDLPSLMDIQVKTTSGEDAKYQLLSIPFYLIGQLPRLLPITSI